MKPKKLILFIFSAVLACSAPEPGINHQQEIDDVIQTDKDFSTYSIENGFGPAFIEFADQSAIMISDGGGTLVGKETIANYIGNDNPEGSPVLEWEPLKAEVAMSGDLAYTFGKSKFIATDSLGNESISWGTYVSVWKKQQDGSWKWVIDAGNSLKEEFQGLEGN